MDPNDSDQPLSTGFNFTGLVSLPGQDLTGDALVCGPDGCLPTTGEPGSGEG